MKHLPTLLMCIIIPLGFLIEVIPECAYCAWCVVVEWGKGIVYGI